MHGTRRGGRRRVCRAAVASLLVVGVVQFGATGAQGATDPVHFRNEPVASWRVDGEGLATVVVGDTVYVGGDFRNATSPNGATRVARANLAAFDVRTGELRTAFRADTNGPVRTLAAHGDRLYVGGSFTTVGGANRQRLAAVDLVTGAVGAFAPQANSNVYALEAGGGRLVVGGSFSSIGGQARSRIAAFDLASGSITSFAPQLNGSVLAVEITADGSRTYAGGAFTSVNGANLSWLATLAPSGATIPMAWELLQGAPSDLALNDDGSRLAVAQTGAGNQGSWYDTTTGARRWRQRCDGDAQAIHIVDGSVFTGFHEGCDGDLTKRLRSNAAATGSRDVLLAPTFDRYWGVRAIAGDASNLVIAGDFTSISGVAVQGFAILPERYVPPPPASLPENATWRYLDGGVAPPADWAQPGFDDGAWASGPAELGYGDGDESTVVSFGPNANAKHITTWFRTTFTATARPDTAALDLVVDDGAVVYLNGQEVVRDNLPAGPIAPTTRASTGRSGAAEQEARRFSLPTDAIVVGTNTLAVEVHQESPGSSDLSLRAAITSTGDPGVPATTTTTEPTTTTTAPTTTTTTTAPTTTTTLPAGSTLLSDSFSGADGTPWPGWTVGSAGGQAVLGGDTGRLTVTNAPNAWARAELTSLAPLVDSDTTFSYRWDSTGPAAYLSMYVRGSGGWQNAYRPRTGYGIEVASNATAASVRRNVNGSLTTIRTIAGAQQVSTAKQWVRLRVVGSTIQFKTWVDGQGEPTAWTSVDTDGAVAGEGRIHLSLVRGSTSTAARGASIDDLTVRSGS